MTSQFDVEQMVTGAVEALGFTLYGCQYVPKSGLLRVFIQSDKGISLGDCEQVSRQIQSVFEVESTTLLEECSLEVSSPGVDRPLFKLVHFEEAQGETIALKLFAPLESGQKKLKGVLKSMAGETISLAVDGETIECDFPNIQKAHVVADIAIGKGH